MATPQQRIRAFYGFDFPDEFFQFREFLNEVDPLLLESACHIGAAFPFAVADGKPAKEHPGHPLWESRYYNDLPEFITIFHGGRDGQHYGYFFDDPDTLPPVVAWYWHRDSFGHNFSGNTLFEAVRDAIERTEAQLSDELDEEDDEGFRETLEDNRRLREELSRFWGADIPETGDDYWGPDEWREPVAETLSEMGILVPAAWYQPLSADPFDRTSQFTRNGPPREQVTPLIAEAFALLREGRPGTALQLGHDLWLFANEHPECYDLLEAAYTSLDRAPLLRLMHEARAYRAWWDGGRK